MNKKGLAARTLGLSVLAIAGLVIILMFIFGPDRLWEGTKDAVKGIYDLAPNVTLGSEDLKGEKPTIPHEHEQKIDEMFSVMRQMIGEKKNCFARYETLPELGEKGTAIQFKAREGKTVATISGGAGGKQKYKSVEIKGMIPCVIAGKINGTNVAENFYARFLQTGGEEQINYFLAVKMVTIAFETSGFDENRIDFGTGFQDFESQSWLFTPDGKHICFFPTHDWWNGAEGLNDDNINLNGFFERNKC